MKKISIPLLFLFIFVYSGAVAAVPNTPTVFTGELSIEGEKAPKGTELIAKLEGDIVGRGTVPESGKYILDLNLNPRQEGKELAIFVNGKRYYGQQLKFEPGEIKNIDINLEKRTLRRGLTGFFSLSPTGGISLSLVVISIIVGVWYFKSR